MKHSPLSLVQALTAFLILSHATLTMASESPKTPKAKQKSIQGPIDAKNADSMRESSSAKAASTDNTTPRDDSSHGLRIDQKANADLLYTPLSDFILQYGIGGSYNMKPNFAIGMHYLSGSKTMSYESSDNGSKVTGDAKLQGSAGYVYGRYFFGNSFNMMAGLGVRTGTIEYTLAESSANLKLNGKVDIQSLAAPVFIGNRWTFVSGMTIGCDWIGAFIPLSGKAKSTLDGNIPSSTLSDLNQKFVSLGDELAHKTSLTLFLTSIGWAF